MGTVQNVQHMEQCHLGNKRCIQKARNHRSTVIIDKIYKAFFNFDDLLHWAHRPDEILHSTFIVALEIEFKLALHLQDEGYATDNNYDLPQPLQTTACVYVVTSTTKASPHGIYSTNLPNHPDRKGSGTPTLKNGPKTSQFWWHVPTHHGKQWWWRRGIFPDTTPGWGSMVWGTNIQKVPYGSKEVKGQLCPQTSTHPQEPIHQTITWEEALHSMLSDMLDVIDIPNNALFQEYLLES